VRQEMVGRLGCLSDVVFDDYVASALAIVRIFLHFGHHRRNMLDSGKQFFVD